MANLKSARIADPLAWLDSLAKPDSLLALAVFAGCVLAAWLMVAGVFRVIAGLSGQFHHWLWVLLHGIITLILGISIWQNWPYPAMEVIGIFIGIDLILNGWTLIMLSFALKKMPA